MSGCQDVSTAQLPERLSRTLESVPLPHVYPKIRDPSSFPAFVAECSCLALAFVGRTPRKS